MIQIIFQIWITINFTQNWLIKHSSITCRSAVLQADRERREDSDMKFYQRWFLVRVIDVEQFEQCRGGVRSIVTERNFVITFFSNFQIRPLAMKLVEQKVSDIKSIEDIWNLNTINNEILNRYSNFFQLHF